MGATLVIGCLVFLRELLLLSLGQRLASATALKQCRRLQNVNLLLEPVLRELLGTHAHRLAIVPSNIRLVHMLQGEFNLLGGW